MPVTTIGAWAMRSALLSPDDDFRAAVDIGLTDVSLCVHSQSEGHFTPFVSAARLAGVADRYAAVGIIPHAMFWPRPERPHTLAVLEYMNELSQETHSLGSVDLDAEEQWTRSAGRSKFGAEVAGLYAAGFGAMPWPCAVNGITAALPKIKDLVDVADIVIPQAYTSTKPGQTNPPGKRQTDVIARWRKAAPKARLVCGLAAYSQEGAGGLSAEKALHAAFAAVEAAGVTAVRYWSLDVLAGSGAARRFVTAACKAVYVAKVAP